MSEMSNYEIARRAQMQMGSSLIQQAMNGRVAAAVSNTIPNALPKSAEPPVLQLVSDRLAQINASLGGASTRIETVTDRVLGPLNQAASGGNTSGDTDGAPACTAASLLRLVDAIALQVERLHEVASRVERIG